ncbi:hypothetical protein ASD79_12240 [Caulobacter sp. Root655]|uniref:hypothetical protein n=1 Tax=Caulobacter sp. Root655 TaxID=1736578 RepID=UPI000701AD12|nr:hypothetical protein [Caulobacter sp. Root655]KRA59436.1 hypothetical protein ASD79_12240 [Caulobacter sp. Root655]
MHHEAENRIAKAALAGSMVAGAIAVVAFLTTGGLALDAATSTLSLSFPPASQGPVFAALLAAGVLKVAGRLVRPISRWLAGRS